MRRDIRRKRIAEQRERREKEAVEQRRVDLRMIERAAIDASVVTNSAEWDAYLGQIAQLNLGDQRQLDALMAQADAKPYMTPEEAQRVAVERALLRARIHARTECIAIPRTLQGAAQS